MTDIKVDKYVIQGKINEMIITDPVNHTMLHQGNFDFNSRVKDNILALFTIGGRAAVMFVLSTAGADDEMDGVGALVKEYGEHNNEPTEVLSYAVLLDYDLHSPKGDETKYATIYEWEAGTDEKIPFVEIHQHSGAPTVGIGVGVFADLPFDQTLLDFLKHTKLL